MFRSAKFLIAAFVGSTLLQESMCCRLLPDNQCWDPYTVEYECTSEVIIGQIICMNLPRCIGYNHYPNNDGGTCQFATYDTLPDESDCEPGWNGYACFGAEHTEENEGELTKKVKEHLDTLSGKQRIDMETKIREALKIIPNELQLNGKSNPMALSLSPEDPRDEEPSEK